MRTSITIITVLALGFGATAASAARRPAVKAVVAKLETRFNALDTNSSGGLDANEWAATSAPANSFGAFDLNENGNIGPFEIIRVAIARFAPRRR